MKAKGLKPETVRLLRRVQRHILEEPRRFDMHFYGYVPPHDLAPACNTAACIAGWSALLKIPAAKRRMVLGNDQALRALFGSGYDQGAEAGIAALGLEPDDSPRPYSRLFDPEDWPAPWRRDLRIAELDENRQRAAEVAVDRIEHFIATGE